MIAVVAVLQAACSVAVVHAAGLAKSGTGDGEVVAAANSRLVAPAGPAEGWRRNVVCDWDGHAVVVVVEQAGIVAKHAAQVHMVPRAGWCWPWSRLLSEAAMFASAAASALRRLFGWTEMGDRMFAVACRPKVEHVAENRVTLARWSCGWRYAIVHQSLRALQKCRVIAVAAATELARSCGFAVDSSCSPPQSTVLRGVLLQSDQLAHAQALDQNHSR